MKTGRRLAYLFCATTWLSQAQTPTIYPNGLVNAATCQSSSSVPVAARGEIVSIYGTNLSNVTLVNYVFPVPTQLGGTQVFFGDLLAPLLYVSPT